MKKWQQEKYVLWSITGVFVGILVSITIYPTIYNIFLSFCKWHIIKNPRKSFCGLQNFVYLLFNPNSLFWNAVRVTVTFTGSVVLLQLLIGLGLAMIFYSEVKRASNVMKLIIILPVLIAPVAIGLIFFTILDVHYGFLNYIFRMMRLPLGDIAWTGDISTALFACIAVDTWQWTPFMFLILFAGIQSLPVSVFEAAKIDGASSWQIFRYVTVSLLKPVILVAVILRTIEAFKTFDMIFLLTHGGPSNVTETLSIFTYRRAFTFYTFGIASTSSVMMLIFGMGLIIILIKSLGKEE